VSNDYIKFFGLSGSAFSKTIPADRIYRYPDLEELHCFLGNAVGDGAVAMLTGPVGAGKSTAVRAFLAGLDPGRFAVIYIGYTASDRGLFREMALGLGLTPVYLKSDLVVQLHTVIEHHWLNKQRQTLLVVDDAHLLADSVLVELRQLLNFQMDAATPLGMVLVGQPALRGRLKESIHEALAQRTPVRYTLVGMSRPEATEYVDAHMAASGGDPAVFTEEALDLAYQHAKGIPRALNNVLLFALIRAAWLEVQSVDKKITEDVIKAQTLG
jgi:general secretion pathway protein A